MLKINATAFLFILELLLVFLGLSILLFLKHRKQTGEKVIYREKIEKLENNINDHEKKNKELSGFKEAFSDLRKKFNLIKNINIKLKKAIASLVPEAEKSEEYKKLIADIEQNNKELDMCIDTLEKENKEFDKKITSFTDEVSGLSRKLKGTVSKAEFDRVAAEKKRLELRIEALEDKLNNKTAEYGKLEKNYMWLEKEYNALYSNVHEEASASATE